MWQYLELVSLGVIRIRWSHRFRVCMMALAPLKEETPERLQKACVQSLSLSHEDRARRWLIADYWPKHVIFSHPCIIWLEHSLFLESRREGESSIGPWCQSLPCIWFFEFCVFLYILKLCLIFWIKNILPNYLWFLWGVFRSLCLSFWLTLISLFFILLKLYNKLIFSCFFPTWGNPAQFCFTEYILIIPGEGSGNPLQYSCLENPMDRAAWQATVHGATKSWTWLSY